MTEFQAATIAYQNAALALQQGQLWASIAIPFVAGLVGAGQIIVVSIGIRVMDKANKDRARQVEAQLRDADQREKRADQRHAENMEALRGLIKGMETVIERTSPPKNTP